MNPTPEQLTRAAELATRVAEIVGWRSSNSGEVRIPTGQYYWLLSPRAFQAVVLALPGELVRAAMLDQLQGNPHEYGELDLIRWTLTPAGMLAFYEALVEGVYLIDGKNK